MVEISEGDLKRAMPDLRCVFTWGEKLKKSLVMKFQA